MTPETQDSLKATRLRTRETLVPPIGLDGVPVLALGLRDAAKALGVCEKSLWTWAQAGQIPARRQGTRWLFSIDALRAWLLEQDGRTAEGTPR